MIKEITLRLLPEEVSEKEKYILVAAKQLKIKLSDIPKALTVTTVLMVFALIANAALGRDFMLLNTGNGSPLVFLLDNGQLVYTLSMIVLGYIAISIIIGITVLIINTKNKLLDR